MTGTKVYCNCGRTEIHAAPGGKFTDLTCPWCRPFDWSRHHASQGVHGAAYSQGKLSPGRLRSGNELVLWEPPETLPFPAELKECQTAIGDLEIFIYEAWEWDKTLTKDAARRFLAIADIFGWDMPWVAEMREWAS